MCSEYNGYPNPQTWYVNLHIGNSRHMEEHKDIVVQESRDITDLADGLKEWLTDEDVMPELDGSSLASDMLGWAMRQVDWYYLARNYWEEKKEETE